MDKYFSLLSILAVVITVFSGGSPVYAQGENQDQYYYAMVCVIDRQAEMFALRKNEFGSIEFLGRNGNVTFNNKNITLTERDGTYKFYDGMLERSKSGVLEVGYCSEISNNMTLFASQSEDLESGQAIGSNVQTTNTTSLSLRSQMTVSDLENLRDKIARCWDTYKSDLADKIAIKIRFRITRGGEMTNSMNLISISGRDGVAQAAAYSSAYQGISRCGKYSELPPEKYIEWSYIEVTFGSSGIRVRSVPADQR